MGLLRALLRWRWALAAAAELVARRDVQRGAELGRKLRRGLEAERNGRGEMVAEIERTAELQVQLAREREELQAEARLQRDRCEGGAVRASRVRELEAALVAAQAEATQAQKAGKLPADYKLPAEYGRNTPEQLEAGLAAVQQQGELPAFPLGSGMSAGEEDLAQALSVLKVQIGSKRAMLSLLLRGWRAGASSRQQAALRRMDLAEPDCIRERAYRTLLLAVLPC